MREPSLSVTQSAQIACTLCDHACMQCHKQAREFYRPFSLHSEMVSVMYFLMPGNLPACVWRHSSHPGSSELGQRNELTEKGIVEFLGNSW